jgi:hypothetical protein
MHRDFWILCFISVLYVKDIHLGPYEYMTWYFWIVTLIPIWMMEQEESHFHDVWKQCGDMQLPHKLILYKRLWEPKSISRCSYYMQNLIIQTLCIMMVKIKLWVVKFSAETNTASAFKWSTYHLLYSISICLCVSL